MNIFSTAPISYAQAALGGEVRINTVDGDVLYEVKPGTQTDTRIRLKGKGVPSLRNKAVSLMQKPVIPSILIQKVQKNQKRKALKKRSKSHSKICN